MYEKVHCKEWTNSYFYSQFESYVSSTCILSMLFWNVTWIWKCTWTWLMFNEKERISKIPKFSFSRFYHFGILWWIIHDGLVSQIHLGLYISLISFGILGRLPNSYGQILFGLEKSPSGNYKLCHTPGLNLHYQIWHLASYKVVQCHWQLSCGQMTL